MRSEFANFLLRMQSPIRISKPIPEEIHNEYMHQFNVRIHRNRVRKTSSDRSTDGFTHGLIHLCHKLWRQLILVQRQNRCERTSDELSPIRIIAVPHPREHAIHRMQKLLLHTCLLAH
ncbi:hypothetical protein D3C85_1133930 [compost metagenome]